MKRIRIAQHLWNKLWEDYSARVSYARVYQQAIAEAGGTVANDHIAFRSLGMTVDLPQGRMNLGIDYIAQIATALGYEVAGEYTFSDKHLYARHYRHPEQERWHLPKLFISELIVEELPPETRSQIEETVNAGINLATVSFESIDTECDSESDRISEQLRAVFARPWDPPLRSAVESVNAASQYGAWVLLHGYAVNHFTGYINQQNTSVYPDLESTARALSDRGVPMKAAIEGSPEVGLCQTATHAVKEQVSVRDDRSGEVIQIPWTYAYYELAQRFAIAAEPGQPELFDGFLGENATHLFEMTRK